MPVTVKILFQVFFYKFIMDLASVESYSSTALLLENLL